MPLHRRLLNHSAAAFGLGLALMAAMPSAAQVQNSDMLAGADAWRRGDDTNAVRTWQPLAERGNADAQFNMGQAYKLGRGVAQDIAMAEIWYRRAASQGHLQAEDNLGLILFASGQRGTAMHYIRKSAARGEARALFLLGTAHFNGDLAAQDWPRAYALTVRASQTGLSLAASRVAELDSLIPEEQRQQGLAMIPQLIRDEELARSAPNTAPSTASSGDTQNSTRSGVAPSAPIQMVDLAPSTLKSNLDEAELIEPEMRPPSRPKAGVTYTPPPLPEARVSVPNPAPNPTSAQVPATATATADAAPDGPPSQPKIIDLPPSTGAAPKANSAATNAPVPQVTLAPASPPAPPVQRAAPPVQPAPKPAAKPAAASGPWRLQLGAFSQPDNARRMWAQLSARYPDIARRKPIFTANGRLTMLYAGAFATRADAVNLCNQLKNAGDSCLILD